MVQQALISRQDLFPWLACLYISPDYRGKAIGRKLLEHGITISKGKGYNKLYLCTTLDNYYERYGWEYFDKGYYLNGEETKIYI
ncbi:GNAT family N-acetyltransferase [Paenibacillus rigui]|uniref:N-acetyltransferase domain-containing protein n=1 Tax=Paenibacillus rigui TaxID=554312 RepID=A0A229UFX8_9BACL|nr:hypothetical protein CF651_31755 [Paenibacillus rigui]